MIQRISRRNFNIYALDIESHNDEESIASMTTSMWLGCFINEESKQDDESSYFYNWDELFEKLHVLCKNKRNKSRTRICSNLCIYIYNLSFEYSFILPYLLNHGYQYKDTFDKDDENVFNSVTTKSCSSVWCVNINFGKGYGRVMIRDLAKIYGGGLGLVAKAFNLPTQKGEIDYRLNRLHNYQVTKEEKEYCFKDTRIIIDILLKMRELGDKDFWNSSSMATYSMKKLLKCGWPNAYRPYGEYRKQYPELSQQETDFLREGVAGGLCYPNENYQFKNMVCKIGHIDKHQMHPSSAYFNRFPYGEGTYFKGTPPKNPTITSCVRIRITYDYVNFHSIIKLISIPFITDYEIVVWDFEIPTMYKCYGNLKIDYIEGYWYHTKPLPWRKYYEQNYRKRLIAKANKDAFYILYYKLLNNSSYGKHLEKPHNIILQNYVRPDGIIDSFPIQKEKIQISAKYTYLPVGSAIPAYSRVDLVERAYEIGFENVLYVDTDSIFFILNEETQKIWDSFNQVDFLGGWGWEETIEQAEFDAPKRYKVVSDGKTTFKAGGINFEQFLDTYKDENNIEDEDFNIGDVPFDEINLISEKYMVKRAFRCKGGTIIDVQEKAVGVQPKYEEIYRRNRLDADST